MTKGSLKVSKRRKKLRKMALDLLGNECIRCGYKGVALDFHHINSKDKSFGLSAKGLTRAWSIVKEEALKCKLLCANCHREIHYEEDNFVPL